MFYDADCGFCQRSVDWLRALDTAGAVGFRPFQTPGLRESRPEVDFARAGKGVQLLDESGRLSFGEAAMAEALKRIPGWRWLGSFLVCPLVRPFSALGYRLVAVNRRRISRLLGLDQCAVPPRE